MIDIKKSLDLLGIQDVNLGASTGISSFGGGEEIASYSPVDGKLIGNVTSSTQEIMIKLSLLQNLLLMIGD